MRKADVVAVLTADWHISHKPPLVRSCEDWYEAMARPLGQVRELCQIHDCPLVIAGDIVDKWQQPPELLTFLMKWLPKEVYATFGQHDLPHHSWRERRRSASYVLVESGHVNLLHPNKPIEVMVKGRVLRLHGFPWGFPVKPLKMPHDMLLEVAVVHDYLWGKGSGYPGAPKNKTVQSHKKSLGGYDVALFGDNHIPQDYEGICCIINAGPILRRKRDEMGLRPSVGLLWSDGSVTREYLDCSEDKFADAKDLPVSLSGGIGFEGFLEELASLGDAAIDFGESVRRLLERDKVDPAVKRLVLALLDRASGEKANG